MKYLKMKKTWVIISGCAASIGCVVAGEPAKAMTIIANIFGF